MSGYLLDQRQPLHYYCKPYNVYCVGQYILCCISYIEEYIIFEKYCIICKTIHTIDVNCKLHSDVCYGGYGIKDYNAEGDGMEVKPLQTSSEVVKYYVLLCQNSGMGVSGAVG